MRKESHRLGYPKTWLQITCRPGASARAPTAALQCLLLLLLLLPLLLLLRTAEALGQKRERVQGLSPPGAAATLADSALAARARRAGSCTRGSCVRTESTSLVPVAIHVSTLHTATWGLSVQRLRLVGTTTARMGLTAAFLVLSAQSGTPGSAAAPASQLQLQAVGQQIQRHLLSGLHTVTPIAPQRRWRMKTRSRC